MENQEYETIVTTHYWGYRELSVNEINEVGGGGDFSGNGFSGTDGYARGAPNNYTSSSLPSKICDWKGKCYERPTVKTGTMTIGVRGDWGSVDNGA